MSYKEGCHPILLYTPEEKEAIRKAIGVTESSINEDIDALIDWFEKQPHLVGGGTPERDFFERMLIFAKGSREKTKRRIDNFFKYKSVAPELVQNYEKHIENHANSKYFAHATISKLYNLRRVSVVQFNDPDPTLFTVDPVMQCSIMISEIRLKYEYTLGDIWILDLKSFTIGHLMRLNVTLLQKSSDIFKGGIGIRISEVHVLGAPSYAQVLVNFFSAFMPDKVMNRVIFHENIECLQKHIPKEYLPKDYGGTQQPLSDYKEIYQSFLKTEETKQYLAKCSKLISNEDKRPNDFYNANYLPGTFKKLNLD